MRDGWEIKKLHEVCEKITDGTHQTPKYFEKGVIFLSSKNVTSGKIDWDNVKYIDENQHIEMHKRVSPKLGDILLAKNGTTGVAAMVDRDILFDIYVSLAHIRVKGEILPEFMLYFINSPLAKSQFNKRLKGMGVPNLHLQEIREVQIPYPSSLQEQEKIVNILDRVFELIDQAKANIEKNIQNAKEMFQSKLNEIFSQKGKGWKESTFSDLFKLKSGHSLVAKDMIHGPYPVYGGNGIAGYHNDYNMEGKYLIIGRVGALCGNVRCVNNQFWLTDNAFQISEMKTQFDFEFLNYLLNFKKLRGFARQAAQPVISNSSLKNIIINYPIQISIQEDISKKLTLLEKQTADIETTYRKKKLELDSLKKSILQKAFTGELTSSISIEDEVDSIFSEIELEKVAGISATDLQAGITAYALNQHLEHGKVNTFHHVKAEKIVHLAEYILNIDLERNPVKDAAGPNDFTHSKKIESRAKKAGFYHVYKKDGFYTFDAGNQIQKVIQKTKGALGNRMEELDKLVTLLIPMNTQQAEVIATVYAAWNNLLLENTPITDEAIVLEARENWHESKLNIERDKFFKAIEWMKNNELLIPKGNGKLVTTKK